MPRMCPRLSPVNYSHTPFPPRLQLWSEASSLRHCPEALWFFYHTMAMSPTAEALWVAAPGVQAVAGAKDRRLVMRNVLQVGDLWSD